jgi:prepilin-type processing-associated H-X9-DG protein
MSLIAMATISAREKGRMTMCTNNHKQMISAWLLYASDYNDRLVPNPDSDKQQWKGWVVGNLRIPTVTTNTALMLDSEYSLFGPYIRKAEIYKCPSDESEFVRSVAMNCRLNPTRFDGNPAWVGGLGGAYKTFRTLSDIKYPSRILGILDERSDSINDSYFAVDLSNTGTPEGLGKKDPYIIVDFPGDYHNDSLISSFADGHVSSHKWIDYVRKRPLHQAMPRISTSPALFDVKWLHKHSSYHK